MGTDHKHRVCTYAEAENAIRLHEKIFINDCFCRGPAHNGETAYEYCGHRVETCMGFHEPTNGGSSYPYREISREEALAIHDEWKRGGHFFRFMEDEEWICCCCACGCGWFRDKEGNLIEDSCEKSPFMEDTDEEVCTQCGDCVSVCAYKARSVENGILKVTTERCSGCSACEYACPVAAIRLVDRQQV